ncbi:MAG TPA: methyltransferase domain-containing protein [Polyangiaceae bacterium]
MSESVDYFANHRLKLRFPWSLYHRPIVAGLQAAIGASPGPEVLNIGAGPFLELASLDARGRRITVCDIDERAVELAKQLHRDALAAADRVEAGAPLPYPDDRFDLVVAMDVIEHLPDPLPWLRELVRVTRRGGHLFLTTPNYASKSLIALETTALELVARMQGFSRDGLHPSKLDPESFRALLEAAGAHRIDIELLSFGWVLSGRARKP